MANELNDLKYNNTPITFTGQTNNTATSDETTATLLYQDKMGTVYSKSKGVVRAFNFAGISLILTAAAIKTGSFISNVFVLNPPTISDFSYQVVDHTFTASFSVTNPNKYEVTAYLTINGDDELVLTEDCKEEKEYLITYEGLQKGDVGRFYIKFSSLDYNPVIESCDFVVEE